MALLTAEDIATALLTGTYSEPLKSINAYVVKDVGRREYPTIDVENITSQERIKEVPTTKDRQIYLVHLYYRIAGFGDADTPAVKLLEGKIFDIIDALQGTNSKISITESWKRETLNFPTAHIHSTLRVTTEEISSTDGDGMPGDDVSISLSGTGTIKVIDVITDEAGIIKDLDLTTTEQVYSKIRKTGLLSVSLAIDLLTEELIRNLIFTGETIDIVFTKGNVDRIKTVNLNSVISSGTRGEIQKQILNMDVHY